MTYKLLACVLCRYDRQRCEVKHVKDMQLLAAMAPPGGGRNAFSQRVQACFATLNVTSPNDVQLKRIFGTLLNHKLAGGMFVQAPLNAFCVTAHRQPCAVLFILCIRMNSASLSQ